VAAFMLRIITGTEEQVMRLCNMFVHCFPVVSRNPQGGQEELNNVSRMTVWRVLCKQLSFQLYKFQRLQEFKPNDQPRWTDFNTNMLKRFKEDNLFLDKTVFSDKATFHLSRKENRHNLIIWGPQNSHQVVEQMQGSLKVKVFCAANRTQVSMDHSFLLRHAKFGKYWILF
jgi:hypothetical protein